MQLKKLLRRRLNKEYPCRYCGKSHVTGLCPTRERGREFNRQQAVKEEALARQTNTITL